MPGEEPQIPADAVVSGSYMEIKPVVIKTIKLKEGEDPVKVSEYDSMENMNTMYRLYGNAWALAREECLSVGKDLCAKKHLCTKNSQQHLSVFQSKIPKKMNGLGGWFPVLDMCDGFVSTSTLNTGCKTSWTAVKKKVSATSRTWAVGESTPVACCDRTGPYDFREAWTSHTEQVVDKFDAIPSLKREGMKNVLRIIINHSVAGFFAAVSWVLSQLLLAKHYGLVPWVDWGPCVLNGWTKGGNPFRYYDSTVGGNAFPGYFKLKGPGIEDALPAEGLNVITLSSTQVWKVRTHKLFSCAQYDEYCGNYTKKLAKWYAKERAHAWEAMEHFEVNSNIGKEADAFWARHAPRNTVKKVLSVHVRGTDKDPQIGGYKVTPAYYYPFIDAFLDQYRADGAKVFLATDSPKYLKEIKKKYGDKVRTALQ